MKDTNESSGAACDDMVMSTMDDGLLRLYLTEKCTAKCSFCPYYPHLSNPRDIPLDWIYNLCRPLYEQIKMLLLVGGEVTTNRQWFDFASFIAREYPRITLFVETNGMTFDERWAHLCADQLARVHVSVNASSEERYAASVWLGEHGARAYRKVAANVQAYVELLRQKDLLVFAPSVSMVLNRRTSSDVREFLSMALDNHVSGCTYYLDWDMYPHDEPGPYDAQIRDALVELAKLKRISDGRFHIGILFCSPSEWRFACEKAASIDLAVLRSEYAAIDAKLDTRCMEKEHQRRQELQRLSGKRVCSLDDWNNVTWHRIGRGGEQVCFAAWKELQIMVDGKVEMCSWYHGETSVRLQDYIKNNAVDWDALLNATHFVKVRRSMLANDFSGCMPSCPVNKCAESSYTFMWKRKAEEFRDERDRIRRSKLWRILSIWWRVRFLINSKRNIPL